MSETIERKKDNLFAKLAGQHSPAVHEEPAAVAITPPADTPPSPAPVEAKPKTSPTKKKVEPVKGKLGMNDHDCGHCQHGTAAIASTQTDDASLPRSLHLIPFDVLRYISHIPDRLPKPNWQPAI